MSIKLIGCKINESERRKTIENFYDIYLTTNRTLETPITKYLI